MFIQGASLVPQPAQLLLETCTSLSLRNLRTVLDGTLAEMRHYKAPEPEGGYTSEDLKRHLTRPGHGVWLVEKYEPLFSDRTPQEFWHLSDLMTVSLTLPNTLPSLGRTEGPGKGCSRKGDRKHRIKISERGD